MKPFFGDVLFAIAVLFCQLREVPNEYLKLLATLKERAKAGIVD